MYPFLDTGIFRIIGSAADRLGIDAYAIGGYVRDLLLKRESKDIDIVTNGKGIELAAEVKALLGEEARIAVFKTFGTAQIKTGEIEIEFVGARKESYTRESRKPVVEDGTIEDDQKRRDFTINALAIGVSSRVYGKLSDPFEGLKDLENGIIRTPLDPLTTYSDDPLRMLRAIRFASQLGFSIEARSFAAISENRERIRIVSMERISHELNRILMTDKPSVGFKLLFDTGMLGLIFPEMAALHGVDTVNGQSHKDNFYHTLEVVDNVARKTDNLWLRWAAVLHDIAKPATKRFEPGTGFTFHGHEDKGARMVPKIFNALKLPLNEKMRYVQKLVLLHLRPIVLAKTEVSDSAVRRLLFEAGEDIDDLMILCESDITTKNPSKVKRYMQNFEVVREKLVELEEKDRVRNWQPPIKGEEIMQMYNMPAGREIGILKNALKDAILDGIVENNYESAKKFLDEQVKQMLQK
jgi:poly(A) polymerase